MAYEIIKRLQATNQTEIFNQLQDAVTAKKNQKVNYIKYLKKALMQKR